MPYRIKTDSGQNLVCVRWWGRFDVGEIREFFRTLEDLDIFCRGPNVLHDAREWNLNVDTAEVMRMAHDRAPASPPGMRRRVGFVVAGDLAYGMIRAYATLRERPDLEMEVFRDFDAACLWLGIDRLPGDCLGQGSGAPPTG